MQEEGSRGLRWKRLLGLVSADAAAWIHDAQLRRNYYCAVLDMYKEAQLPPGDAAAMETDLREISSIIPDHIVRMPKFMQVVSNVLTHWGLVHENISYKHGMHLLAAVIVYVLLIEEGGGQAVPKKPAKPAMLPQPPAPVSAARTQPAPPPPRPPPPRNGVNGASQARTPEYQQVMDPSFTEHDAFYMFSRVMEHLERMFVSSASSPQAGQSPSTSPITRLSNTIQYTILAAINPQLLDHLRRLDVRPLDYTETWVTTLFASAFPLGKTLIIWDQLFLGVAQASSSEARASGMPLLSVLCTSLLIALENDILARRTKRECVDFLLSVHNDVDPTQLAQQARCLQDPFYVASMAPNIEVVEFTDGPLGLVLVKAGSALKIASCDAGGQAEQSGRVQAGDVVFAVNGVKVPDITPQQMVDRISRIGRPLFVAFEHADDRMSLHFNGFSDICAAQPRATGLPPPPTVPLTTATSQRPPRPLEPRPRVPALAQPPSTPPPSSSSSPRARAGNGSSSPIALRASDGFSPAVIPGEQALSMVPMTLEDAKLQPGSGILEKIDVNGVLFVTSYRLIFHRFLRAATQRADGVYWQIPIHMLWKVDCSAKDSIFGFGGSEKGITVHCKNGQVRRFNGQPQMESAIMETNRTIAAIVNQPNVVFPFLFCTVNQTEGNKTRARFSYDLHNEYGRVGLLQYPGVKVVDQMTTPLCETYPRYIVVPAAIVTEELQRVAAYRSKQRIPIIVWSDPESRSVIARCAQPLVGIKSQRSPDDERYLALMRMLGGKSKLYIVDARSRVATIGNKAIGKGTELVKFYPNVEILFMDIGNIHSVRESEASLHALFRPWSMQPGDSFSNKLEQTGWLGHINAILSAALRVVDIVRNEGCNCLVHCSDGWDRTAQLTSLSMLLLDPYHRSLPGFFTVVEKEWLDFGHKFHDRSAHGSLGGDDERSPIFVLWLDCVWQLVRQFPTWFEFNERFLLFLADNVYSCRFGTFLYNSYKERREHDVHSRTVSIWSHVEDHIELYRNPSYSSVDSVLIPSCNPKNLKLWEAYFCRFDPSLIPTPPLVCDYV